MNRTQKWLSVLTLALACPLWSAGALGQGAYPNRPVKVLVTFAPGGSTDVATRLVAAEWKQVLGQEIIIENRGGASGMVGWEAFKREKPDGYSLTIVSNALPAAPWLLKVATPDVITAFQSVALFVEGPIAVLVNKDLPARNFRELLAYAKANPGKLNYAISGGSIELDTALFTNMAGLRMVPIQYKGASQAAVSLAQGETHLYMGSPSSVKTFLDSGAIRAIGIATDKPWPVMPELPVIGKDLVPGFYAGAPFFGVSAPQGLPRDIAQKLQSTLKPATQSAELRRKLAEFGFYISEDQSPEALDRIIKDQYVRYGEGARIAGVKPE